MKITREGKLVILINLKKETLAQPHSSKFVPKLLVGGSVISQIALFLSFFYFAFLRGLSYYYGF